MSQIRVLILLGVLGFMVAVIVATGNNANTGRSGYPRSNRGFRNSQLSTARGFGKRSDLDSVTGRNSLSSSSNSDGFPPVLLDSSKVVNALLPMRIVFIFSEWSWLIELLQNNPEVARFLERLVNENGDGELTPGESSLGARYY